MQHFYSVNDVNSLEDLIHKAVQIKKKPQSNPNIGKGKTILLLFFNASLRTRLSTQKAAYNLGMNVISMNASESWQWELEEGAVMKFDKAEHIKDAAKVISQYVDIVGIRAFPGLQDRELDYQDLLLSTFIQYSEIPVINLESAILHPLQSLTDIMTIEEFSPKKPAKVVLSWAPHPKILPQAVSNSFLEWMAGSHHQIAIANPEGYDLDERFTRGIPIYHNQKEAFDQADCIYAKNWSSLNPYGGHLAVSQDWQITEEKMNWTNDARFMHCLPVRRNVVVADAVIDSKNSLVYQQAENRVYACQAVLETLLTP